MKSKAQQFQEEAMKILIDLDDVGILANRNEPNQDARIARRHGRDLVKKWKDEFPPEEDESAGVLA